MTRITNFARKRTYVQAGFADADSPTTTSKDEESSHLPRKERKCKKPSSAKDVLKHGEAYSPQGINDAESTGYRASKKRKLQKKDGGSSSNHPHRSESRRLKRVSQRQADIVCFMCRNKGHTAKECPKASASTGNGGGGNATVGICYRCGSRRHTLSRCKKPEDPLNPLPFASCFVCSKKGHLASACPKNTDKGVYPNGGCCKLCGEKTHLAKDCALRKHDQSGTAARTMFGTGKEAGADEDDFHVFKRKNREVSKSERDESKQKKQLELKVGVHTGTVKSSGDPPPGKSKKVVHF